MKATLAAAMAALTATLVHAHAGCDGYLHGQDLSKREPSMASYEAQLRARHPQVNARVMSEQEQKRDLEKRASPTTYAASLTRINSAGAAALSSGSGNPNQPTMALPRAPTPGATSPVGGQPLPQVVINPADWPTLDRPPPPDSPQVQQWLSTIDLSGVPNFAPTQTGYCANASNAQAVADANARGWWTCQQIPKQTRSTDITYCPQANTWGVSYDDGPSPWTPQLLTFLDAAQLKTTIFTVGSRAISRPDILQYEYLDGHQIAVHTWSHFPLTTLSNEQIVAELGWSKKAIYDITGVTPRYMRPPYGDIDDRVRYISLQMGLIPIIWTAVGDRTYDTQDWQIAGGVVNSSTVIANFDTVLNLAPTLNHGFIVLQHDLYQQSVNLAIDYVLPKALSNPALSLQPIITCLGLDAAQAYVETASNSSAPVTSQFVGASGTVPVAGLTYTPPALGGDYTSRPSSLAYANGGSAGASAGAINTGVVTGRSSGAAAVTLSLSCLLLVASAMFMMA